ncbi:hypothetical protein BD324DRAFT_650364 [Kockovaella imperatae]|uniref:N-acetyltransferase domain-containing protein n=1 Tax=Kockovaella imperatae TaxID=4999 RepID=A0A1Y1UIL1_9TREE|nr:hypothetical protein BD324DRAFT_650364 [Kockovaella imperatae]ORX37819.1 hypothetical protein BD324DRAFT_650364 [Kockovaella imperatae]
MTSEHELRDLSECTLVAANHKQFLEWCTAGMVPWGAHLSPERYITDSERDFKEDWGKDGALQVWALVRRDDPQGSILSACATQRRTGLVKRKGSSEVEKSHVYGIASVVTPVQNHKRGYASHMLKLLHYILADPSLIPSFPELWGQPPQAPDRKVIPYGIASILWSDVGSIFYSKCTIGQTRPGWVMPETKQSEIIWKTRAPALQEGDERWERIRPTELPSIGQELRQSSVDALKSVDTSSKTVYTTDPSSVGLLDFIPLRGSWTWEDKDFNTADPCGLRFRSEYNGGSQDTIIIFGTFNASLGRRTLITYVHNLDPRDLSSLLRVIDAIAFPLDQKEGWIFGLEESRHAELIKAWQAESGREAKYGHRAEVMGHLLGVAYYGPEGEHELLDPQMYSWC